MEQSLSHCVLRQQNTAFAGTGGVSHANRSCGFIPAFHDTQSGRTVASRFADGSPAPLHVLDGVPRDWIVARNKAGRVSAVKDSVIAGFLRQGRFYTRSEAAEVLKR